MTLKERSTLDNAMTQVDYYKLWQPLSTKQFAGNGMYNAVKEDVGAYDKGNINEQS
jgi:replication initiation and membrane attachment protein DnaB